MGLLRDVLNLNKGYRFRYRLIRFFSPQDWFRTIKWRKQRANRGWSDYDTWGAGEHLMAVARDMLFRLEDKNNSVDWEYYFSMNYPNNYGYNSLTEVAEDLDNYLYFEENQFNEEYDDIDHDTLWRIEYALQENAINAMHFVAANIHGLWW